ncbi:hypothetical protein ZEAMMB73_Zm00001d016101 [Zea mays]|uniref:Uncharacterized protein n=1 Tax=Zea mays TaxID=4577 RepID=A0A1D6H5G8_MAIZE|nr:hypothetical protein ZEAMMB73_Zm00001d016101 [Zea mays]
MQGCRGRHQRHPPAIPADCLACPSILLPTPPSILARALRTHSIHASLQQQTPIPVVALASLLFVASASASTPLFDAFAADSDFWCTLFSTARARAALAMASTGTRRSYRSSSSRVVRGSREQHAGIRRS